MRPRGIGVGQLEEELTDSSDDIDRYRIDNDSDWEELYDKRKEVALYDSGSDED